MNDQLHKALSELRFEERSPFFEDAVMAKLERAPRRHRSLAAGVAAGLVALTALSFAVQEIAPLHVTAYAEPRFTVTQADIFNFALTGKLPVDDDRDEFLQLTPQGDLLTIDLDTQRSRFHALASFYQIINADRTDVHRFDSILEACALQLSTLVLRKDNRNLLGSVLFGMNQRLTGEMMRLSTGEFPAFMADSISLLFRQSLMERLAHREDSLIAAASDSIHVWPDSKSMVLPGGLTEPPAVPIHNVLFETFNDSIEAVRNRV